MTTIYRPELLYVDGSFVTQGELWVGEDGVIVSPLEEIEGERVVVDLPRKALLPGFVNAHSHTFQRLIRGKAEARAVSGRDFWSWRGTMYHAANQLDPQQVYDVARMAFLEMVLAGTTTVGEFHYLHNAPDGQPYDDPNLLSKQVIAAAQSVGLRIVLLRTAYLRSGFGLPADLGQTRFFETATSFIENMTALVKAFPRAGAGVRFGVAPHSLRAVPLRELREIAEWTRAHQLPLHMHVAEQVGENDACLQEYGSSPVALLHGEQLLGQDFTAVHAVHVTAEEIAMLAAQSVTICSCPTTERNLGDGILRADDAMTSGIQVAFGSDSQAQIDSLEDARELEYHLRLKHQKRAILDFANDGKSLPGRLFDCATVNGTRALGMIGGDLRPGTPADFFTVDLNDLSIAGSNPIDLLSTLVFGMDRTAIQDVAVNGKMVIRNRRHVAHDEIVTRYVDVHRKVWHDGRG